jgi:hypothetical protein
MLRIRELQRKALRFGIIPTESLWLSIHYIIVHACARFGKRFLAIPFQKLFRIIL